MNKKEFKCNHCGHEQVVENYNPLDLYLCKKCNEFTTERETKMKEEVNRILDLMFEGYNKKQIAERMDISIYKVNKWIKEYKKR